MKYMAYCIFSRNEGVQEGDAPVGIGGTPTYVIDNSGLSAAISAIPDGQVMKDSSTILIYHKVIESFHNRFGAIPLRLGTIVDDEAEIGRVLEEHGERYKSLLKQLAGCVEMGIRIIIDNLPTERDSYNETPIIHDTNSAGSGAAYLASRKARIDELQLTDERNRQIIVKYRAPFEGLFVKFKGEALKSTVSTIESNAVVLSLYFLVPRRSVAAFHQVYDQLMSSEPAKIMLSGPWPPYNFVLPGDI
jgi:hypothetical protein